MLLPLGIHTLIVDLCLSINAERLILLNALLSIDAPDILLGAHTWMSDL